MRRFYLLRHGKAEAGLPAGGDRARALTGRGRRASRRVGAFCRESAGPPTLALCSPARRTVETCRQFREGFGEGLAERILEELYMGSPGTLLRAIQEADDAHESLILIGHNPGLQGLAAAMGAHGPGPAFARLAASFPTAALAVFETGVERWAALAPESARLATFVTPRDLG